MKKRWKIGVIRTDGGTESGHSREMCARLFDGIYDAAISVVYGENKEGADAVAGSVGLCAAPSAAAVIAASDAVMIMHRNGTRHREYAAAALSAGVPVFVDKPLACSIEDAKAMVDLAEKNKTILFSGSAAAFSPTLQTIGREVQKNGALSAAYMAFPLNNQAEYGGIHFYTHHLLCAAYRVFGGEIRDVTAHSVGENVAVTASYDTFLMMMNFAANYSGLHIGAYFQNGAATMQELSLFETPRLQLEHFLKVLNGAELPQSKEELLWPVKVSGAIEESIRSGKTVTV